MRIKNKKERFEFFENHIFEFFENEKALFEQVAYMQHTESGTQHQKTVSAARELVAGGSFLIYYDEMNEIRKENPGCIDGRLNVYNAWDVYTEQCVRAVCRIVRRFEVMPDEIHGILANVMYEKFLDHHASDLYVKKTPVSTFVINQMKNQTLVSTFVDNIGSTVWYELPFCFNPSLGVMK